MPRWNVSVSLLPFRCTLRRAKTCRDRDVVGSRFGSTKGLGSAACTADCTAGYFCPPASTTDMVQPCGAGYYCPSGTDAPKQVEPGYCWIGSSEELAESQELCLYIDTVNPVHGPTSKNRAHKSAATRVPSHATTVWFCDTTLDQLAALH